MDLSLPENDPDAGVFSARRGPAYYGDPGVFDAARTTFDWLVTGPHPVTLDGRTIPGLPPRPLRLDELGRLLLAKDCPQGTRDASWARLITRSRAEGGAWTVACVGLALPVLLPIAARLTRRFRGEVHDIHAAVLDGFLSELCQVDLARPAILVRLRWAAYRAGYAALREALDSPPPSSKIGFWSAEPHRPSGHPDFVLVAAVDDGAITTDEAALIGSTRFGELSLTEAAECRGQHYEAAKKARQRAEQRLAAYLAEQTRATDEPPTTADTCAPRAGSATASRTPAHPAVHLTSTHRVRLRSVTRVAPRLAEKLRRPMSPEAAKSGVSGRGTRLPARARHHRSPRPATRPDSTREARSCD
ncbi:sigma-70 family RNA polymerase sigma factor [Amycolatopsis aidingensis]|uniref:sigma-70 family RNA polymerase sigma factor n=1 Tax=Amycolatopsis aidingensis TaxID=2842453 RepID=UPI001C0BC567|nr:sigma-70 family RNA polymerase sigma factor [Amycolatopsis aidingensis]